MTVFLLQEYISYYGIKNSALFFHSSFYFDIIYPGNEYKSQNSHFSNMQKDM